MLQSTIADDSSIVEFATSTNYPQDFQGNSSGVNINSAIFLVPNRKLLKKTKIKK